MIVCTTYQANINSMYSDHRLLTKVYPKYYREQWNMF